LASKILRHKDSLGKPQAGRFLKVIDCLLDGSRVQHMDTAHSVRDRGFLDSLPEQGKDVIRVILDGDESMLQPLGPERLYSGPQCVNQPRSTYASRFSDGLDVFGDLTHGKAYYWPHLRDMVSGNRPRRWFFMDTFAYHNEECGYWKGDMLSKLLYTGSHESNEAYITVAQDSVGRYIGQTLPVRIDLS
jgi:hypothetical protein